jgi:multidrug resistance efflux pump
VATASWAGAGREWLGARVSPEAGSRGTATRARRRLWAAIDDAEAAVNHADATDAPVADLPAVCRSLRTVAGQLDTLLRLERRLPLTQARPDAVRVQVADVIRAAHDVQSAALRASSDATEPQIRALVRDASAEVELVAAALARMRSISPG